MGPFAIQRQWSSARHEEAEVAHTSAMLKIILGNETVTRNEDDWAQTVRDDVHLSAYPLALWLASSWWRLRWEPIPTSKPSHSWRMSHEMGAVGYGYVWPRMLFASDGDSIHVWAVQTPPDSKSPVRYLANLIVEIGAADFERGIDDFVNAVIARLDVFNMRDSALNRLWKEVLAERRNEESRADRRLEALLGFDPDESPQALMQRLKCLIPRAGASAIGEVAAVCGSRDAASTLTQITALADSGGLFGRTDPLFSDLARAVNVNVPGWQRGRALAHSARNRLGLNGHIVTDETLCGLIGIRVADAFDYPSRDSRMPLGMGIRDPDSRETKFVFRKRNRPGRRFEIARFLCDQAIADADDSWLPTTDEKTSRQRTQRSFAAEFLCPIEPLKDFLGGDFSTNAIDEAVEHFGVSSRAIETQLVNHHVLPSEILVENASRFGFPYFAGDANL